ncbi:mRNA-decapping enzyme 1A [Scleropages formosus]|nr:mRNA-decapping enzyme 1A [Scleropages formosus]
MEAISKAGHHMSLAALQQHDPYINEIVDVTGQVALYTFNAKANEWEKTDIEGTLFVYTRSASPYHGFTIMNRLSMENLVEPINKDLEFQLQDPFLLYRNASLAIYSIWFYDKNDCQRIAQLMTRVVKQEALQAQQAPADSSAASRTNGCVDDRPVDILELLSKAKEEYQRGLVSESDASTNAQMEQNKEPLKPTTATMERGSAALQHDKNSHSGLKQITVEELFGSSLPKDPAPVTFPSETLEKGNPEGLHLSQNFVPSLPHDAALVPHLNTDPRGDHTLAKHNRLLAPGPTSLSDTTGVPGYNLRPSPVFHTRGPGSSSPLLVTPRGSDPAVSSVRSTQCPPGSATYLPQDLLSQLKMDRLPTSALSKPGLTPSILPAGPQLATPECFREPILKPAAYSGSLPAPVQVVSMKAGSAASAVESSVLLSPSVFQNSVAKTQELERKPAAPSPSSSSLLATELPTPLSRHQLQDTLIHLIKNDSRFLSTIHEAYLQSISKDLSNVKL